jgi:hypothetical protein
MVLDSCCDEESIAAVAEKPGGKTRRYCTSGIAYVSFTDSTESEDCITRRIRTRTEVRNPVEEVNTQFKFLFEKCQNTEKSSMDDGRSIASVHSSQGSKEHCGASIHFCFVRDASNFRSLTNKSLLFPT